MNNKVKFLRGTSNEYAVAEKDNDTIYFTTDDGKLYIGDKEVSGSDITIDDTLSDTSTNPVQGNVIKQAIDNKADKTVATTSADGLMSASDKSKLDDADNTYALKSKYGDTTIDVGRKSNSVIGMRSTAEGIATTASGNYSHAEGSDTVASGSYSHAEGCFTTSNGTNSHAEGSSSRNVVSVIPDLSSDTSNSDIITVWNKSKFSLANGLASHVENADCLALGHYSHAEGGYNIAIGNYSHVEGLYTIANNNHESACGTYNKSNADTLFSIGDGTSDSARHNAFEITTTGGKLHDKDIATTDLIPSSLPANGGNADYATNADKLDGHHEDYFAKSTNPSIEGSIHLLRSGNATTNGSLFAWEETVRIRNEDPNAENTTYTDFIVTPSGVFTEGINNGNYISRGKLLTESDIQTNIAGNTIFVKPNTKFPTINSAIAKAVSEQKSYTIYISEETYIEDLDLRDIGNISLEFVGVGNVSVSSNTAYPQGALYCMSNCIFRNISFFANNSYAVHIEFNNAVNSNGDYATDKNIRFENCTFGSQLAQCVGIGLGQGCTVSFTNCVMQRGFYAHNQAKSNVFGQGIRLNGCQIYGNIQIDDAAYSHGCSNSVVNIAITNTSATEFIFVKDRSGSEWVTYDYIPNDETNVILDVISGGNSYQLNGLNNGMSIQKYQFQNVVANSTVSLGHLDKFVLPLPVDYTLNNTIVSVSTDINSDWVMLGTGILTSNSYVIPYYNYYTDSISGNIILTVVKL